MQEYYIFKKLGRICRLVFELSFFTLVIGCVLAYVPRIRDAFYSLSNKGEYIPTGLTFLVSGVLLVACIFYSKRINTPKVHSMSLFYILAPAFAVRVCLSILENGYWPIIIAFIVGCVLLLLACVVVMFLQHDLRGFFLPLWILMAGGLAFQLFYSLASDIDALGLGLNIFWAFIAFCFMVIEIQDFVLIMDGLEDLKENIDDSSIIATTATNLFCSMLLASVWFDYFLKSGTKLLTFHFSKIKEKSVEL